MLYKILLILHGLFELAVSLLLLLSPALLLEEIPRAGEFLPLFTALSRAFSVGTLSLAMLSFFVVARPLNASVYFSSSGALAVFHVGMTLVQVFNIIGGMSGMPVVLIHGSFAVLFMGIFIWQASRRPASA